MNLKKKGYALLLTLSLSLGLAVPVAAGGSSALYIHDGKQLHYVNEDMSGDGWSYDYSSSTLTLNGFHGKYINFYENENNTLYLTPGSENTVEVDRNTGTGFTANSVISSENSLSIQGSGSLAVVGGISATKTLEIQSGTIETTGKCLSEKHTVDGQEYYKIAGSYHGLEAETLVIKDGTITAKTEGVIDPSTGESNIIGANAISYTTFQMIGGSVTATSYDRGFIQGDDTTANITGGSFIISAPNAEESSFEWGGGLTVASNVKIVGGSTYGAQNPLSITKESGTAEDGTPWSILLLKQPSGEDKPLKYICFSDGIGADEPGLSAETNVNDGVVSATVDGTYHKGNNSDNVEEAGTTLSIDATATNASGATTSNVTINSSALTSIEAASIANVEIKTNAGTLKVDADAWKAITENATANGKNSPVVLHIEKTDATATAPLSYTLTATSDGKDVFSAGSAKGQITVTVPYTQKAGAPAPNVYYIGTTGIENMHAIYTAPAESSSTGSLSWKTSHFSDYIVDDGTYEAMLTTTNGTIYTTLSEALTSAATSGGAITLLKDVALDSLNTTINSNVVISGKGTITATVATGATTVGLTIAADKSLTLDGVKLIINGTKDADAAKGNNGTALSLTSGSNLKLENGATLELKDLERGIIMPGTPPVNGTVTVDASTLTASGIDGNFSNGGKFVFQNGSTATIDGCGSYGISANNVTVDNSTLTVKNTGYSAIYASDDNTSVIVQNGGKINVSDSGKKLPYTSSSYSQAYSPIDLGYKNNGELTVGKNSSITLTGNNDKDSKENNSIYLSNTATLNNEGTITGEIKTAEVAGSAVRITYLVDGQTYHVVTASPDDGQSNVTFEEPTAPTKSGYRFLGWGYGQNVAVTSGTVTLTPVDDTNTYTFTAQWSKNSSSSGGGVTTYAITTNSPANGTVTVSSKSAAKDATVTITVAPASGYQLDKLTVADKDGKGVALTDKGNGKYTFTMPASKVEVTATFKQAPVTHVCPAEKYTDVDTTQWYHEGVDYVIEKGMMNGTGTNTFEPNSTTTRGMIVTILYRLEKEPAAGTSPFTDVDAGQWYAKAVAWAAANGVVNGTSPTTFNPNDPITREQMAAILYRYASFKGYDVTQKADLAGFTDAAQISDYAKDPMAWANKAGLIGGVSATTLQPQGSAIRAQVATILMRFCENVVK